MIETSTNGAAHAAVNRVGVRARKHEVADGRTAPNGNGHARPNGATVPPSTNGDNGGCGGGDAMPAAQGEDGRDARGRFARGNAGGPGNPFARQVAQFRRALCDTVTEEDIQAVARTLVELAKQGDVAAARLLLSYTIGQPAPAVNPDTLDLAEWDIFRRTPTSFAELSQCVTGPPVALACKIASVLKPLIHDGAAHAIGEALRMDDASFAAARVSAGLDAPTEPVAAPSTNGANGKPSRRKRDRAAKPIKELRAKAPRSQRRPKEHATGRTVENSPQNHGEQNHKDSSL